VPERIDVAFRLDGPPRLISFADVHRLACYLAEDARGGAHQEQVKPFTAWPLLEDTEGFVLRINSLDESRPLARRVAERLLGTPHLGADLPLVEPRTSVTTYTYRDLAATGRAKAVTVEFVSPATFSRNGRSYGLPDPVLIHQQLARRWNVLAPAPHAVDDAVVQDLCSRIVVSHADLEVRAVTGAAGRIGFTGRATFELTGGSAPVRTLLRTLWAFAEYSGVGAMTAHGLGAVAVAGTSD